MNDAPPDLDYYDPHNTCDYCGAKPGKDCIITRGKDKGKLAREWHRGRVSGVDIYASPWEDLSEREGGDDDGDLLLHEDGSCSYI
jgi:hypothetical protein